MNVYPVATGSPESGIASMMARRLFIVSKSELPSSSYCARRAIDASKGQRVAVEAFEIEGDGGRLEGVAGTAKAAPSIHDFLVR